jgi:hypothetical protein
MVPSQCYPVEFDMLSYPTDGIDCPRCKLCYPSELEQCPHCAGLSDSEATIHGQNLKGKFIEINRPIAKVFIILFFVCLMLTMFAYEYS